MSWEDYAGRCGATGYSRAVEQANDAVRAAQKNLQKVLETEYPEGAHVRVVHHRGSFYGNVTSHDHFGARVEVENSRSGKKAKWWAAQVEVV